MTKQQIIQQFMQNEIREPQDLFLLHQTVCTNSQQQEANQDVRLLLEYPDRLNEVLLAQWRSDVKRAMAHAPCWQESVGDSLPDRFAAYCTQLHSQVADTKSKHLNDLAIIIKTLEDPESMGRFPSPVKTYVEQLIKS